MLDCNVQLSPINPAHKKGMLLVLENFTFRKAPHRACTKGVTLPLST